MASFEVRINGAAGGPYAAGVGYQIDITDDDSDRVLAAIVALYNQGEDGATLTDEEAIGVFIEELWSGIEGRVLRYERDQAAKAARAAVPALPATVSQSP